MLVSVLWSAGFLVGTTTHVIDIVVGGVDVYSGSPTPVRVFWLSLTVLDPSIVVMLWLRMRTAVVLGVVVIVSDVGVNATVFALHGGLSPYGLVAQIMFALLIVSTAPWLWKALARSQDAGLEPGPP